MEKIRVTPSFGASNISNLQSRPSKLNTIITGTNNSIVFVTITSMLKIVKRISLRFHRGSTLPMIQSKYRFSSTPFPISQQGMPHLSPPIVLFSKSFGLIPPKQSNTGALSSLNFDRYSTIPPSQTPCLDSVRSHRLTPHSETCPTSLPNQHADYTPPVYTHTYRTGTNQKSDKETSLKSQDLDQQNPIDVAKIDEQEAMIIAMNAGHTDHIMHHNVPTPIGSHAVAQKEYCDTMDSLNNSGRARANVKTKMGVRCGEELVEVPVNVNDTLYNRLHKGGKPLDTPSFSE
ncbi:hypothetical protein BLNAU_1947 [Blattamonas nauphoetae]|uniref:Uncharacterized protein n=1 Tax=Blattamonas nauphoetae TaxID=2049346 RepID=A0ABQ9YGP6_9EUKA|nr:hypothetical protein BLNAU_1947 [Blattamonas nauphoetae]